MSRRSGLSADSGRLPPWGRFVAGHRRSFPIRKIAGACRRYLSWYANVNYDLASNGESFVLDELSSFTPRVIFDVGANFGEWSFEASSRCPKARIHAFEISAPSFEVLAERTRGVATIECTNKGLADESGSIRIRHYDCYPTLTTATDYPHPFPYTELDAELLTGDAYARERGIGRIDLLKIDVEGMEERVLRGFGDMFCNGSIDLVQFEYGRVNIMNRFLLRDFYAFFEERGFLVGKIFPDHVEFKEYDFADEDFLGPNYLACREDRTDYLRAFGGMP